MKYWLVVGGAFLVALLVSWTPLAARIDNDAYDWMSRLYPVQRPAPEAAIVAVDESLLKSRGGMRALRSMLAQLITRTAAAGPKVIAIDFTLADLGDPSEDAALAAAMANAGRLVLATDIAQDGSGWQDPPHLFAQHAVALGHVHAEPDPVCRRVLLDKATGTRRRWALALEAWRGDRKLVDTPDTVELEGQTLPREAWVRFSDSIPVIAPEEAAGRAVFIGATALTAARDRLMTPLGRTLPGVEIHAQLYETLREGRLRRAAPGSAELAFTLLLAGLAGITFRWRSGWTAYLLAALILLAAHAVPHAAFRADVVFPSFAPLSTAWLTVVTAATYQYFAQRNDLRRAQADRTRYQQAIHWVTHEMRTPLTAIQGSSELMSRYNLPDAKRRQIVDMINAESKRLARMVETFLSVERLNAGHLEMKHDPVSVAALVDTCLERTRELAARKSISLTSSAVSDHTCTGDRELLDYALYNLVTNAIKYSPEGSCVTLSVDSQQGQIRVAVQDQGIGIEERDLAKLGTRFFRTRRSEEAGIQGTGIGLSIVQEIIRLHGGRLLVASRVGAGSCFTIEIPASVPEKNRTEA